MKKRYSTWLTVVLVTVIMVYPFESTVVPAWRIRVVDKKGEPYVGKRVRQAWKHYTLEYEAGENIEDRLTDSTGYAAFPERTIRAPLLWRTALTIYSAVMTLAHGGYGIHADVAATGPQGYTSVKYVPNKPLPEQIVLPSQDEE